MDKTQKEEENGGRCVSSEHVSIAHDTSLVFSLLLHGFKFSDSELEQAFEDEIIRCCLIEPARERAWLLAGKTSFCPSQDASKDPQLITVLNRIFDITLVSDQKVAFYDVAEIRKIEKLGYDLHRAILVHPHPKGYNSSPSLCDIASFLTTDLALKKSLHYAVVSFLNNRPIVTIFNFKQCTKCPHSFGNLLEKAPVFDFKEVSSQ